MNEAKEEIRALKDRLQYAIDQQRDLELELRDLKAALDKVSNQETKESEFKDAENLEEAQEIKAVVEESVQEGYATGGEALEATEPDNPEPVEEEEPKDPASHEEERLASNVGSWESFVGKNLMSKIGVGIIVLGVGVGARYAIERDMISPVLRIVLGYFSAITLMGFAFRLKQRYNAFSAALLSGALCISYFISYLAYSEYGLMPRMACFILMLLFTAFSVLAAIKYQRQIIAHLGLVGAYALPILLSNNQGEIGFYLSYVALINVGILIISLRLYWRSIFYTTFGFTWLSVLSWLISGYNGNEDFWLAAGFCLLFFIGFQLTFLAYKLRAQQPLQLPEISLSLSNSAIFFSLVYTLMDDKAELNAYTGLFAVLNAALQLLTALLIKSQKGFDKRGLHLFIGLSLTYLTIAVPIQLDGSQVSLIWILEAAVLFWIGRKQQAAVFEFLSYPLLLLSLASLFDDWLGFYTSGQGIQPAFINIQFLSSLLFVGALGFISYWQRKESFKPQDRRLLSADSILSISLVPAIILLGYLSVGLEIALYFDNWIREGMQTDLELSGLAFFIRPLKTIYLQLYTLCYLSLLLFLQKHFDKNQPLLPLIGSLSVITMLWVLSTGLNSLGDLRMQFLDPEASGTGWLAIFIRYPLIISFWGLLLGLEKQIKHLMDKGQYRAWELVVQSMLLIWISNELIHWLSMAGYSATFKLSLSILWGLFSFWLVVKGIWKRRRHLRLGAISLFAATLLKVFLYDIAHLETIAKTIVFISLGILLLLISFLYNKFTSVIADDE